MVIFLVSKISKGWDVDVRAGMSTHIHMRNFEKLKTFKLKPGRSFEGLFEKVA